MDHRRAPDLAWSPAPSEHFTGEVWFAPMVETETDEEVSILGVLFEPQARTDWHRHPGGQTIYVVGGAGYVATEAGEVARLGPGDVVTSPPGQVHWHGAAPNSYLMHLSITSGGPTEWLGVSVTDDEYRR